MNSNRIKNLNLVLRSWLWGAPLIMTALCVALFYSLIKMSYPSISSQGLSFFTSKVWDPSSNLFTARPFILGTFITSLIAIIISAPISILIAIYIVELSPARLKKFFRIIIEVFSGIPSIIIGLWGIFTIIPIMREIIAPFCNEHLSFIPFLKGTSYGVGIFTASIILSIMIIPIIASFCCEIFSTIPRSLKEAAQALGATRYEMIKIAIIAPSTPGIIGATILGLARAMGETMAVTMVIGNTPKIITSLWDPSATLASIIANDYAEASSGEHIATLGYLAMILLVFSFLINRLGLIVKKRMTRNHGSLQ